MFIIWGTRGVTKHLGYHNLHCFNCQQVSSHSIEQTTPYFTLYFIPLFARGASVFTVKCYRCYRVLYYSENPGAASTGEAAGQEPHGSKWLSPKVLLAAGGVLFLLLLVIVVVPESESAAWSRVQQQNTISGFRAFLEQHPGSAHATQAQLQLSSLFENRSRALEFNAPMLASKPALAAIAKVCLQQDRSAPCRIRIFWQSANWNTPEFPDAPYRQAVLAALEPIHESGGVDWLAFGDDSLPILRVSFRSARGPSFRFRDGDRVEQSPIVFVSLDMFSGDTREQVGGTSVMAGASGAVQTSKYQGPHEAIEADVAKNLRQALEKELPPSALR